MKRTEAYRFTTAKATDYRIDELKVHARLLGLEQKAIEIKNEYQSGRPSHTKTRYRVVVRARLGTNSPYAELYRYGGKHYRVGPQTIRPEHGSRFDVYLQRVRTYA